MAIPFLGVIGSFVGSLVSSATTAALKFWGVIATAGWFKERSQRKILEKVVDIKDEHAKIDAQPKFRAAELIARMLKRKRKAR